MVAENAYETIGDSQVFADLGNLCYIDYMKKACFFFFLGEIKGDFPEISAFGTLCCTDYKGKASCGLSCVFAVRLSSENQGYRHCKRNASRSVAFFYPVVSRVFSAQSNCPECGSQGCLGIKGKILNTVPLIPKVF